MSSNGAVFLLLLLFVVLLTLHRQLAYLVGLVIGRTVEFAPPTASRRIASILRLRPGAQWRTYRRIVVVRAHRQLGRPAEAMAELAAALPELDQTECPWWVVNVGTDLLVSAGRYRDALRLPSQWTREARARGRIRDPASFSLTRINQAEALHNLGRDDQALLRLRRVANRAARTPLAINGLYCLRAWILVHRGDLDAAREDLARIDERALHSYRAELCYTRAALERDAGDVSTARLLAEEGLKAARGASSVRNGMFVLGGVLARMGEVVHARALFDQATRHRYRGQGGDGLSRFASLLDAMGDDEGARRVRRLLVERDPESFYATRALQELTSPQSKAPAPRSDL